MSIFDYDGPSIDGMRAAAAHSGLVGELPLLFVTSDYREGGPYHGTYQATDWGNNGDQWNSNQQMDDFAVWLGDTYGPVSLEIIHTRGDGTGVYWKNGVPVDGPSFYGMDTVNEHRGHDHWAITNAGLALVKPTGDDPMAALPTVNFTGPLAMNHPNVRTVLYLMAARGMWLDPGKPPARDKVTDLVKSFQTFAGLTPDGVVGPSTWAKLFEAWTVKA